MNKNNGWTVDDDCPACGAELDVLCTNPGCEDRKVTEYVRAVYNLFPPHRECKLCVACYWEDSCVCVICDVCKLRKPANGKFFNEPLPVKIKVHESHTEI